MYNSTLPSLNEYQVLPPFKDDVRFEEFVKDFFNSMDITNSYDRYGRTGQKQNGLDVFSEDKKTIIQCKMKLIDRPDEKIRAELLSELNADFNSFKKYNKANDGKFKKFIFASTFKNDTFIHDACNAKSSRYLKVEYWHWDRILSNADQELKQKYFGLFFDETKTYYGDTKNINNSVSIEKSQPILNQIYQYINIAFKEVQNLPPHLLAKQYPFRAPINNHSYYKKFNLTTNNKDLFHLFDSIKLSSKGKIIFEKPEFIKNVSNSQKKS